MADQFNILDQSVADFPSSLTTGEESFPREHANSNGITQNSGTLRLTYFTLRKSGTRTQVVVSSGGTAAGATPTLVRVGLWRSNDAGDLLELLAATPNDTSLLAGTFSDYTKTFSASFGAQRGMRVAAGLLVVTAAAAPTVCGSVPALNTSQLALAPRLSAVLTGLTDLPTTAAAGTLTNTSNRPWFVLL